MGKVLIAYESKLGTLHLPSLSNSAKNVDSQMQRYSMVSTFSENKAPIG